MVAAQGSCDQEAINVAAQLTFLLLFSLDSYPNGGTSDVRAVSQPQLH